MHSGDVRTLRIYLLGLGLVVREMGGLIRRDALVVVNLVIKSFISFHFILNSLYRVKSTITIDLQATLLKT